MQNLHDRLIQRFDAAPIPMSVLRNELKGFASPGDKAAALVREGFLVRLKRGLFCVAADRTGKPLDRGVLANALYAGPSYVSFETALARHGLIPERVTEVQSAVMGRAKVYETSLGRFSYHSIPQDVFGIGVSGHTGCLMASPEKALCDLLLQRTYLRLSSAAALRTFLEEDIRLNFDGLPAPDTSVFTAFARAGHKRGLFTALERLFA